jgi:hypothetical protein
MNNCAFYSSCIEPQTDCGEGGYALGYGEKYCTRYLLDTHFSPAGVAWKTNVMHCLQESLVPLASESPAPTCDTVLNDAFDSHPHCYTEGPSICFLPPCRSARSSRWPPSPARASSSSRAPSSA